MQSNQLPTILFEILVLILNSYFSNASTFADLQFSKVLDKLSLSLFQPLSLSRLQPV